MHFLLSWLLLRGGFCFAIFGPFLLDGNREPLYPVIDEWIEEDLKRKRKHRRTGTKIYNDLKAHEEHGKKLSVGIQTVVAYVSRRKKELCNKSQNTAMYGLHPPCYAQVDFGEVLVKAKNGAEEKRSELIVSFPFSNAGFAQICQDETKESLCETLQRIFEFIGGVPLRILFDNMSSAVVHIEEHGNRQQTVSTFRFAESRAENAVKASAFSKRASRLLAGA